MLPDHLFHMWLFQHTVILTALSFTSTMLVEIGFDFYGCQTVLRSGMEK